MTHYPLYPGRNTTNLNGSWQFQFCGNTRLEDVNENTFTPDDVMIVPGTFDTAPRYRCKRGTGLYRKEFFLTKDSPRGVLKVDAAGLRARFSLDGKETGFTNLPYSGVEFETGPLSAGKHVITAAIDNMLDAPEHAGAPGDKVKLFLPKYDFYAFGGFYRGITLHQLDETALDRVQIRTLCHETGKVALRFLFSGKTEGRLKVRFRFDTENSYQETETGHGESVECHVPAFRLWTPESPALHTLEVQYGTDTLIERFGIRTIRTEKKQILLNSKSIYLKGFNRHESHPETGAATPEAVMLEDLQNLKKLNCNFVRGAHYPQDQRFLDLCDETGFLVWEESLGWGNSPLQMADEEFQDLQEQQTRLMVRNSVNHPSVIFWGFLNECDSGSQEGYDLCKRLVHAVRKEDASRLVTFACAYVRNDICSGLMDVISYNIYPGWVWHLPGNVEPADEILPDQKNVIAYFRKNIPEEKPMLVSEMGCCGIYGQHDIAGAQWTEEFQAEYLEAVINAVSSAPEELCGLAIWQFTDSMSFHRKGTGTDIRSKPLGLNLAGVFDPYRRKKLAADKVKELYAGLPSC